MTGVGVHTFKSRGRGRGGCAECGYSKGNEAQHGHSCTGKVIFVANSRTLMHCYECGKRYTYDPIPVTVRWSGR